MRPEELVVERESVEFKAVGIQNASEWTARGVESSWHLKSVEGKWEEIESRGSQVKSQVLNSEWVDTIEFQSRIQSIQSSGFDKTIEVENAVELFLLRAAKSGYCPARVSWEQTKSMWESIQKSLKAMLK